MTVRWLRAMTFAASLLCAGCASNEIIVRSEAIVPYPEILSSTGDQRRLLPWSAESVAVSVPVRMPAPLPGETADGNSPGLAAALVWLNARDEALERLRDRIAPLPASEPPPGESASLSLGQFIDRRPALGQRLTDLLNGADQTRLLDPDGDGRLTLRLPLAPVAQAVLDLGGGFSEASERGRSALPENRARRDALEQSLEQLQEDLFETTVYRELNVRDWANLDRRAMVFIREAIDNHELTASEPTVTEENQLAWRSVRETDATEIVREARAALRDEERMQRRARDTMENETEEP